MQKRTAIPSHQPRPIKRRRRTATEVLAGYFDPRPQRDFFTDMANTKDTTSAFNSFLGHGPGIIFDIRTNEEKRMVVADVQNNLARNISRVQKELAPQRSLDEQSFRNTQRQFEYVASASSSHNPSLLPSGVEILSIPSINSSKVVQPPDRPSKRSTDPEASSSHSEQPQHSTTATEMGPSSCSVNTYQMYRTVYPVENNPQQPTPDYYSLVAPIATTASRPSASQMASPPTPTRSVASFTSHTSSRRPRTPEDDVEAPFMHLGDRHNDNGRYESYPGFRNDNDDNALLLDGSRECRGKYSYRGPSSDRESSRGDIASPNDQDYSTQAYSNNSNWRAPPPIDVQSNKVWANRTSVVSPIIPPRSPLQDAPSTPPSFAHRRNALSLAGLLSPSSAPYQPLNLIAIIPPTPQISATSRPADPPVNQETKAPPVTSVVDDLPDAQCEVSKSTIHLPCLSPLISDIAATNVDTLVEDARLSTPAPTSEQGRASTPFIYIESVQSSTQDMPQDGLSIEFSGGGVASDSGNLLNVSRATRPTDNREMSVVSEHEHGHKGRRSKAMLVIESDEEGSENEESEASRYGKKLKTKAGGMVASTSKVEITEGSGACLEKSLSDLLPYADHTPSTIVKKGIPKKKRAAVKKGWKGWVEVEVEDNHRPGKQILSDMLPAGERRTRSGKQFDA